MQSTHAERRTGRLEAATSLPLGWTTAAPLLCAIHCAAMPALVAMAPALSKNEIVEVWLLGISVIVASGALWFGARRHGRSVVWIPVSLGLTFWGASLAGLFQPLPEVLTTTAASLTVAGGLIWNSRFLSTSEEGCHCPVCEDTTGAPE
jgi:hypothetical protein